MATQGDYGTFLEEPWGKGEGHRESFPGNNINFYGVLLLQCSFIMMIYLFRNKTFFTIEVLVHFMLKCGFWRAVTKTPTVKKNRHHFLLVSGYTTLLGKICLSDEFPDVHLCLLYEEIWLNNVKVHDYLGIQSTCSCVAIVPNVWLS